MAVRKYAPFAVALASVVLLAGCSGGPSGEERGRLARNETLLSITATGRTENRPDLAVFTAGLSTIRATGPEASKANGEAMTKLVAALAEAGVPEKDIQTANLSINRIDWGPNKNKFEANNQVTVKVRKVDSVQQAIAAATGAGANVLSGPSLTMADPEKARLAAYGNAFKAAEVRAKAYAEAAGLEIKRVVTIRDGGMSGGPVPYATMDAVAEVAAQAAPPPPVAAPPVMVGTNESVVTVAVDFALEPKSRFGL